jgi:hypothetical protein
MKKGRKLAFVAALAALSACRGEEGPSGEDGRKVVSGYLAKLAQAYRAADEDVVDPLVTERLGRKLVGLIGVKRDTGIVLDAELLEISFVGSERRGGALYLETRERWHYRDRRIGSGEQVGSESTDAYRMRYRLVREGGALKVDEIEFVGEPQVGRKVEPMKLDRRTAHGLPRSEEATAPAPKPGNHP